VTARGTTGDEAGSAKFEGDSSFLIFENLGSFGFEGAGGAAGSDS